MPLNIDDLDDEYIWAPSFPRLTDLEKHLRCGICKEFYRVPVSLKNCKHTFCSECIRNHFLCNMQKSSFTIKPHCPHCNAEVNTAGHDFCNAFHVNHQLQLVTESFIGMREQLKSTISAKQTTDDGDQQKPAAAPSRRSERSRRKRYDEKEEDGDGYVQAGEEEAEYKDDSDCCIVESERRRDKKSRRHYAGMKKKKLQDLCREEGLSTTGSEKDLAERHKAYVTLWNTECDSLRPRSQGELVAEIHSRERARRQTDFATLQDQACMEQLKSQCQKQMKPTTGNEQFNRKLHAGFAVLLNAGKERMQQEKKRAAREQNGAEEESESPPESDPVNEDDPTIATELEADHKPVVNVDGDDNSVSQERCAANPDLSTCQGDCDESKVSYASAVATAPPSNDATAVEDTKENYVDLHTKEDKARAEQLDKGRSFALPPDMRSKRGSISFTSSTSNKKRCSTESSGLVGPWNCSACTFYNETNRWSKAVCEMCGTQRPDSGRILA